MLFWGWGITGENNIIRSTIYCPRHLHNKAKEAGINISKEVKNYLETILFGDNVGDVQYQLEQLYDKKKTLEIELTTVKSRIGELEQIISEHDSKRVVEQKFYDKFLKQCLSHIRNSEIGNISLDYNHLCHYWKKEYFDNSINEGLVKDILYSVKQNQFSFEQFQKFRRGDFGD